MKIFHMSSFANDLRCQHCGKKHSTLKWPVNGDMTAFFFQVKPGNYNLPVTCPYCRKEWFVVWDNNPGPIEPLTSFTGNSETLVKKNVKEEERQFENRGEQKVEQKKVRIKCPYCGSIWKVQTKFLGKKGRCSKCNNHFISKKVPDEHTTNSDSRKDDVSLEYEEIRKNQWIFDEIIHKNYSNIDKLTYITTKIARILANHESDLLLNGLTSIAEDVAHEIAQYNGHFLNLDGLTELSTEVAHELAKYKGIILSLNGLKEVSTKVSYELAKCNAKVLILDELLSLNVDTAHELSKFKKHLSLGGLTSVTVEVARELAKYNGDHLSLNGLTEISADVAHELVKHKSVLALALSGLTSITVDVSRELSKISWVLYLDGLTTINVDVAREFSKYNINLSLKGLTSINVKVAHELAKQIGAIYLNGLTSISDEAARELAKHRDTIYTQTHIEEKINKFK